MDLIDNYRHIRIFVSSTFQDLEEERNFLMRRTFPKLRDEAAKYGVTISEMDLRWGITEEESKLGRVLQICLEEVDNAIPFFIGIIGKRYGWIPSAKEVNPIVLDTYPQVSSYLDDRISITEMEMRYGVLERKDDVNALFFISEDMPEPDKSEDYEKLINLRNNIIDSRKYPVYKYSNVNEISDMIESYILQFLKDNYTISSENSISDEIYSAYLTAKSNLRTYVSNESYFNTFFEWMQSKSNVLYVVSESGLGKTTLLSSWIASLMEIEEERLIVLPHFVGINKQHISGDNMKESILNQILMFIDENSKRTVNDLGDLDEKLSKAISLLPDQYSIILFIDGINQIPHKDKSNFLKWIWLNGVMPNLKVVVSLTPDDYNTKILKANNAQLLTLTEFNATEKEEFILSYLYYYGKRLNKDSLSLILNSKNSNNTLVLKTLLDAIILFGTYESVNSDIREYVSCESTSELFQLILSSIEREFGDNLVKNVLSYIFVSHDGLTDDELIELCYTIPVVWAQLSRLLKSFICKQSGKYKFPHVIIREVIKKKYHSFDVSGINKYKENLISYFEKEKLSIRSISELPYLYVDIEHYDSLYEYLLNQNVLEYYIHNKPIALSSFWRTLKSANKNYCIIDYIGKIDYGVNDIFPLLGKLCMSYLNDNYAADMFFQENLKHSQETYVYMQSLHDEYGLNESNEAIDHIEIMPDHLSYAGSFCNLGDIKYSEGDYISALMYYHKAVGIITDESQFFDKDYIEERSKHIELFFRKDDEYYRIAYALHRLGNTYDELGNLDIACILYERACQYLSYCETNSDSLLREIFHDWALSMPKNKATEALNLLEYSLNLSYKVGGIQDSNIPKTLSLMGTIYHDYLDDNENAMLCYNKGIEILCSLEDVNDSLGNLYYNRASLHPDISDKISDTKRAIAIYQNNYSLNQLIEGYNGLAIIYYNDKQFIEA